MSGILNLEQESGFDELCCLGTRFGSIQAATADLKLNFLGDLI
jgi:hypothetical protein